MVIGPDPARLREYKACHANPRPEVLDMIRKCNIRNSSIYYKDGYLFSDFEDLGENSESDMARMAADPKTQEWRACVKPGHRPPESRKPGERWAEMEEVFQMD